MSAVFEGLCRFWDHSAFPWQYSGSRCWHPRFRCCYHCRRCYVVHTNTRQWESHHIASSHFNFKYGFISNERLKKEVIIFSRSFFYTSMSFSFESRLSKSWKETTFFHHNWVWKPILRIANNSHAGFSYKKLHFFKERSCFLKPVLVSGI
jgi:hypothetical protein